MNGMNPEPMKSHALADRFRCAKCSEQPEIVSAKNDQPTGIVTVKLKCHGETVEWSGGKNELYATKDVFTDGT